jgi:hypothetical protein
VWGVGRTFAIAATGHGCRWQFDGNSWSSKDWSYVSGDHLTGLWSDGTAIFGVGNQGAFRVQKDSPVDVPIVPAFRDWLTRLSVPPSGRPWAIATAYPPPSSPGIAPPDVRVVRWTAGAWQPAGSRLAPRGHALWANADDDVWFAGSDGYPQATATFLQHWDGTTWGPRAPTSEFLINLWGRSQNDVWAVGRFGLVLHWDGAAWNRVAIGADDFHVGQVWGTAADSVWLSASHPATGEQRVYRWDGRAANEVLRRTTGPGSGAPAIWASGANDLWVGGSLRNGRSLHWDGRTWEHVEGDGSIQSIWGTGPHDVWMLDDFARSLRHWDGATWTTAFSVSPGLSAMRGSSARDVWAVGERGTTLRYAVYPKNTPR